MSQTTGPAIERGIMNQEQQRGGPVVLPARGKRVRWSRALTGMFMDHLAATGDIKASARLIGIDAAQAYYRQRTCPAFAEAWDAAIEAGYRTVEVKLIGHVLAEGDPAASEDGISHFDWEQALRLMAVRDRRAAGKVARGGPARQVATRDETDRQILKQLASLARRKRSEADHG